MGHAQNVKRILTRLLSVREGENTESLAAHCSLPAVTAERILKSLTLRGLVKHVEARWVATRLLFSPQTLIRTRE